ncbi:MAG: dihydrolipoyl dehydrogenase [Sporomusaceae bacterium]|nr:dihydrolipoyl dehydrogenase [Sporomusaceae bacterium]
MDYDMAVIGGGPGGYVAAIRAAQLGAKVLLLERAALGGVCLNRGCIPTKTLLKSAEKWRDLKRLNEFGIQIDGASFQYSSVRERMLQVTATMRKGIEQLMGSNHITVKRGIASLCGIQQIKLQTEQGDELYTAEKIIIATGSETVKLPVAGGDLPGVIDSDALLNLPELPKRLAIVGAGAVGVEFAAILQTFGCEVTLIEMASTILPNVDSDIVKRMAVMLRKQGIKLLTKRTVTNVAAGTPTNGNTSELVVTMANGDLMEPITVDKVLVSIGRKPLVHDLALETAGVAYSTKGIVVNEKLETNIAGIYAIGDVTGKYMWAHAASAAGMIAAENACGQNHTVDYAAVPSCIYTTPEAAMVGITEETLKAGGKEYNVGKFNFAANGKAVSMGETDGFVKILSDKKTDKLLGMHILGPHASDLIMEGVLAMQNGLTVQAVAQTIHPHPGLAEAIMECAHGIGGVMIHQAPIQRK